MDRTILTLSTFTMLAAIAHSQREAASFAFEEIGASQGFPAISTENHGNGVSIADVDQDGDLDFFIPNTTNTPHHLYLNDGSGFFTESAAAVGLDILEQGRSALWFDYDGDRDYDLIVANDLSTETSFRLYRQDPGFVFTDVTVAAELDILAGGFNRGAISAGDINNDGFLDVYCAHWDRDGTALPNFFLNDGDGTFTDITGSSGILTGAENTQWQPLFYDFDQDGWQDLYIAIDFDPNVLAINQQNNTFVDAAGSAGVDNSMNDMGIAFGDYDCDGDFDLYISNIKNDNEHNVLYRNDSAGSLSFTEVSQAQNVDSCGWAWGCTMFDADNDGFLDLAVTNGFANEPHASDTSRFFRNTRSGPEWFTEDRAAAVEFDDSYWGVSLLAFDSDRDGDLDLAQSTNAAGVMRLLENQLLNPRQSLAIQPRMPGNNYFGIGTVVRIETDFNQQMRLITAGTSYLGQEPAEAFFGTGYDELVDVTVEFPDGTTSSIRDVSVGQVLEVNPPPITDFTLHTGTITSGHHFDTRVSDNTRMRVSARGQVDVEWGWSTTDSGASMDIAIENGTFGSNDLTSTLWVYNWTSGEFDSMASWQLGPSEQTNGASGLSTADYLSADGRARIRVKTNRPMAEFGTFVVTYDSVVVTIN